MPKRGRGRWSKRRRVGTEKVTEGEGEHNSDSEKAGAGPSSSDVPSTNAETQGALTNHLILKEVFKHLAVHDLLNFSFVSHFWNSCARTVLRDNKKCVAFIRRDHMCRDLKKLNDLISNSVNIPFNGLSIQRSNSGPECLHKSYHIHRILKNSSAFYSNVFDMITFKYFDIKLGLLKAENDNWREGKCPGEKIMKEIIKNSAEKLEGLSMPYFSDELVSHSLDLNEDDFNFPKLKYLEMPNTTGKTSYVYLDRDFSYAGRQLLQSAPNVKSITGWVSPSHLEQLAEQNQLSAVRDFHFEIPFHLSLHELDDPEAYDSDSEDVDGGKKYKRKYNLEQLLQLSHDCFSSLQNLTKLSISTISFKNLLTKNKERWFPLINEIYTGLLSNSSDTLQELKIYQLDLVLLSKLQLPPLHRVRSIELIYVSALSWTLTMFNWPQVFPNVTSVTITQGGHHIDREAGDLYITEQMYGSKSLGNETYTCASVTDFTYDGSSDTHSNTGSTPGLFEHRLAKVFPNVRSFSVRAFSRVAFACATLWTAWPEVETIALLDFSDRAIEGCFDHCFTGMTQYESKIVRNAILDGKDVSDLIEKYQTLPSIRDLTKLKTFRVTFDHVTGYNALCYYRNPKHSDEFFITEVTKQCALDFMPSLNFEIHGNTCKIPGKKCCYTFRHLEPNVKLFIT